MAETSGLPRIDAGIKPNPYPLFARKRAETPVYRALFGGSRSPVWMVTRYADVVTVLKDPRFSNHSQRARRYTTTRARLLNRLFAPLLNNMLNRDQPDHTRLRGLVHQAFTPKRVEDLRKRVEALTHELADRTSTRLQWDIVKDYAVPIPTTIIAEMLGVPAADRERFRKWSNALLMSTATTFSGMAANLPRFMAFQRYLRDLIKARRRDSKDDLISALVAAEEAGDKLNENELLAMMFLLLIAGYETTMGLIGNGTLALLEFPLQMEKLRSRPDLVAGAVEEFARYYSPVDFASFRFALEDVTLSETTISKGETAVAVISSANRDEAQFDNPEVLNIEREPNRHLGFGQGIHYCLGAPLARLEAQVAFTTLIQRFEDIRLAVPRDHLKWRPSTLLRGLESLPVKTIATQRAMKTIA